MKTLLEHPAPAAGRGSVVVLRHNNHKDMPYSTHVRGADGGYYWGHYHSDLVPAVEEWLHRVKQYDRKNKRQNLENA